MVYAVPVDQAIRHFPRNTFNITKSHILDLLKNISSLKIARAAGPPSDVHLEGTIPVAIGTSSYNIPVSITIPVQYPNVPVSMRVVPTSNMYIAASRHIDKTGLVYHPYLHSWNVTTSNIYEFVCVIIGVFARVPPVYSKPPPAQSSPSPPLSLATQQQSYQCPASQPQSQPNQNGSSHAFDSARTSHAFASASQSMSGADKDDEDKKMMEAIKRQSLMELLTDKIKRRIMEISEMEKLKRDHRTLTEGKMLLEEVFSNLKRDEGRLQQSITIMTEKTEELQAAVEPLEQTTEARNIDEEVKATAPLYAQLLKTVAEENAIQDTIYQLGRALNNDEIALDEYLKLVRNLSRDQFMKRALILKARKEAGLR